MSDSPGNDVQCSTWNFVQYEADRVLQLNPSSITQIAGRFAANHQEVEGLIVDWSRQRIDEGGIRALDKLADDRDTLGFLDRLARGEILNLTENRSVMHMALRDIGRKLNYINNTIAEQIATERKRMLEFAEDVRQGRVQGSDGKAFTDIVHCGIGGSHWGPALVCDALQEFSSSPIRLHFCSNSDPRNLQTLESSLPASTTLLVVASKSNSTFETLANARRARTWLTERLKPEADLDSHFVHISSKPDAQVGSARKFWIPDSVGGRFSLWSSMGLPIAIFMGRDRFLELLEGANAMDLHVLSEPTGTNVAIRLATLAIWNTNFLNCESHLVLPYDSRLKLLTPYCQQLEMESNGKRVDTDGETVGEQTSPVVWGGLETDGQHAWHQLLHQGTRSYSADIVASLDALDSKSDQDMHEWMLANAVAQSAVMLAGTTDASTEPHRQIPGGNGSTVILLDQVNPRTLGALLALYEHKVAACGHLWGINSFDQWGVEEGKLQAGRVHDAIQGEAADEVDPATAELLLTIRKKLST